MLMLKTAVMGRCAKSWGVPCRLGPNPDNPNQQLIDEQGNPIDEFPHRTAKTAKRLPADAGAGRDPNPQPAHALASLGSSWSLGRGVPLLEGLRRQFQGLLQGPGQGQAQGGMSRSAWLAQVLASSVL